MRAGQLASRSVWLTTDSPDLESEWCEPTGAVGIVLFAHGSGSSRHSPCNQAVAHALQESGTGTLLFDLLTREEESEDARDGHLRFDICLLARRLVEAAKWVARQPEGEHLGIGYFGSSTGGAAALVVAAVEALRQLEVGRIVVAAPTAALSTVGEMRPDVDELVAVMTPADFMGDGKWYEDFSQTTDEEVRELLKTPGNLCYPTGA